MIAQQIADERLAHKRAKEALTLCRRDVRKLILAGMMEKATGDWQWLEERYLKLIVNLPRTPSRGQIEEVLSEMVSLRDQVIKLLAEHISTENMDGNDVKIDRHIQNSKSESLHEFEPASENGCGEDARVTPDWRHETLKGFPLAMVLRACPEIAAYAMNGKIESWRELMSAAVVVRSMLGVSPSAYESACEVLGAENAATVIACILERAGHIRSAGGYLRDLTRRAAKGEFSLGRMLMALHHKASGD